MPRLLVFSCTWASHPIRASGIFVVVEWSAEVSICRHIWGGIRLLDEVYCDLGLWEKPISQVWGKIVGYAHQDAEEMGCEVVYGHLGCIVSVTFRWH